MKKLFGTDGVRGLANRTPMTPEMALTLGQAIAFYFTGTKKGGRIVVGKDTRRSSYMFEYALCAGLSSMGLEAILTGPLPTPGIAYLTSAMRADAGVVISASHNSFEDNGIKFFDNEGFKLPDEVEAIIEKLALDGIPEEKRPIGSDIGRAFRIDDASGRYIEFLKSTFPKSLNLKELKIVIDCANGAAYKVAPLMLEEMDALVYPLGVYPDGTNINKDCGALYPQTMIQKVKEEGAHIGIALDGDADRVILCDEKGNLLDGDQILALCAIEKMKKSKLTHNTVVGTVMTNMGLENFLKDHGINLVRTQVGDRYIMEAMRKNGFVLGGEPSGHIIFLNHATTGDGLLAALQILALMVASGKPLSELVGQMSLYPQKMVNIKVKERKNLDHEERIQEALKLATEELAGEGRVVLRYSGTEPLLRVMVEAKTQLLVTKHLTVLQNLVKDCLC
ncbi:MAG: hypothetical protein ACD_73C00519G0003 [uncultured bacterium]|nr:MAG: hypothetical protein ACD_73C00519G0003 [uncultured bacterium]